MSGTQAFISYCVRMPDELKINPHDKPTRRSALIFYVKATLLQIDRAAHNIWRNETVRFPLNHQPTNAVVVAESKTRLWLEGTETEKNLALGKVHNLRLALQRLHGAEIPADSIFSFWAQIGRASRWQGYVAGRELREGCIIPTIGGGLCQLSNALYDAALSAGFEIIERHAHTRIIPGSLAELDRDATVFWNYVDLRFKSSSPFRIEATMDANLLTVRLRSTAGPNLSQYRKKKITPASALQSCVTCDEHGCFRYVERREPDCGRAAYLLDEYYPEFDHHILRVRHEPDLLAVPLAGKKFRKGNYAWSTENFQHVTQSRTVTLLRAYQSRKLASQGPARQQALLAHSERLARSYSKLLTYDITHVTVSQNLLPFLWREGYLGGRTFDVLMTALPLARLHERLDAASALHPESKTLADFRADDSLVRAESEALRYARRIITPHSEIAALYENKVVLLDWAMPSKTRTLQPKRAATHTAKIVFPASTIGRKGAYELRAAIEGLDVRLITMGADLEGPDFWRGKLTEHRTSAEDWLAGIDAVVLPAFVEHKPRRLLEALAFGTPVIASQACGLAKTKGVINVPVGDVDRLREEITRLPALQRQS
jgi:VanW like protein/Glycosyl transferases group 1